MPSSAVGIIPARLGSTRFPSKVLADRTGMPLIRHVYEAARRASSLGRLVVATDDDRVVSAVRAFGGECVLTRTDHPNGTSRLSEAAAKLELADDQIVVNVQGDEPELDPATIDACVKALVEAEDKHGRWIPDRPHAGVAVATAASSFAPGDDPDDPNCVKVVRTTDGRALYFSRARIPFLRDAAPAPGAPPLPSFSTLWHRHVGLYVYRVAFLHAYARLPGTALERAEQLEQLRVLENGCIIAVAQVPRAHAGIDTPEQYSAFVDRYHNARARP